jgi:hypothetical protein
MMNTETKVAHTLGPWDCYIDNDGFAVYQTDGKGNGDHIMCIPGDEESKANARLIAAAPDLLEALKTARRVLEVACGTEAPYIREAFKVIDPAIQKAEGQS